MSTQACVLPLQHPALSRKVTKGAQGGRGSPQLCTLTQMDTQLCILSHAHTGHAHTVVITQLGTHTVCAHSQHMWSAPAVSAPSSLPWVPCERHRCGRTKSLSWGSVPHGDSCNQGEFPRRRADTPVPGAPRGTCWDPITMGSVPPQPTPRSLHKQPWSHQAESLLRCWSAGSVEEAKHWCGQGQAGSLLIAGLGAQVSLRTTLPRALLGALNSSPELHLGP